MLSDKFLIKEGQWETVLDKVERFATCYNFPAKEVLKIRLLAEEVITIIRPTLALSEAYCQIDTSQGFGIVVNCAAGSDAMDEKTRDILLKIGGDADKKGVFGMIGRIFGYLADPALDNAAIYDFSLIHHSSGLSDVPYYFYAPALDPVVKKAAEPKPAQEEDHSLELSIVESYADAMEVYLRKGFAKEQRLEIIAVKNFGEEQLKNISIIDA